MSYFWQRIEGGGKPRKPRKTNLEGNPQLKGVCVRVYTESPKKPNSAKRKVAKVRLSTGKLIVARFMGQGFSEVEKFKRVLIRGGRVRDLPGVRNRVIRGKYDARPEFGRIRKLSKYGLKKPSKPVM